MRCKSTGLQCMLTCMETHMHCKITGLQCMNTCKETHMAFSKFGFTVHDYMHGDAHGVAEVQVYSA
jgi:hypothetical protein